MKYETIYEWVSVENVVKPSPENTRIYDKYYQLYKKVRESLMECYDLASRIMSSTRS